MKLNSIWKITLNVKYLKFVGALEIFFKELFKIFARRCGQYFGHPSSGTS